MKGLPPVREKPDKKLSARALEIRRLWRALSRKDDRERAVMVAGQEALFR